MITIVRREHRAYFTVVPNAVFADARLSVEAKGVLGYLLSRPHKWRVPLEHVGRTLKVGRKKLQRIFRELIDAGYVTREPQRFVTGRRFGDLGYVVRDVPLASVRPVQNSANPQGQRDPRLRGSKRNLRIKTLRRSKTDLLIRKHIKTESPDLLAFRERIDRSAYRPERIGGQRPTMTPAWMRASSSYLLMWPRAGSFLSCYRRRFSPKCAKNSVGSSFTMGPLLTCGADTATCCAAVGRPRQANSGTLWLPTNCREPFPLCIFVVGLAQMRIAL